MNCFLKLPICLLWTQHQQKKSDDGRKNIQGINNIIESLMKETILNDETMAPLSYLLSSKFLSSDFAQIGAYVISAWSHNRRDVQIGSAFQFLH